MASVVYRKEFIGPVCPPAYFTAPQKYLFVHAVLYDQLSKITLPY